MAPTARKNPAGRAGPRPARARHGARLNPLQQLVVAAGATLLGVLPCSRRIRAANDPDA